MTSEPAGAALHPEHDAVARDVRGWYTSSAPEIDYHVTALSGGYLSDVGANETRLILTVDTPAEVPSALAEARAAAPTVNLTIWVDDRERAGRLDGALRDAGCQPGEATTHLALVGDMAHHVVPAGLNVTPVEEPGIEPEPR